MRTMLALFCCIAFAAAQDEKKIAEALCASIESGHVGNVLEGLEKGMATMLSADLEGSHSICAMAARQARRYAAGDADAWKRLAEALVALGVLLTDRAANDATALSGKGEALLCRARVADAVKDPLRAEDWRDALECFVKAHEAEPGGGERIVRALRVAEEGGSLPGADPALASRGTELFAIADKSGTKGPELRAYLSDREQRHIATTLATDRTTGKKLLEERLAALAVSLGSANPPMLEATAYNNLVTLAKAEKKLGINAKYVARTVKLGSNALEIDVPVSSKWKWTSGDLGTLYQYDNDGGLLRTIDFDTYRWDIAYTLDGMEIGGDNLKGLARLGEYNVLTVIVIPKSKKPVTRRRLNGHIPQCQAFEIGGLDEDGTYLKFTKYYFKAKETKLTTFKVTVLDIAEVPKFDPEAEFVLDSIREPTR